MAFTALSSNFSEKPNQAMSLLALGTTFNLYPLYLAPALILIARQVKPEKTLLFQAFKLSVLFLANIGIFLGLAYLTVGSWSFLESTYGTVLFFTDLTPNIGMWWYFFTEMFTFFRPFFTCVFHLYVMIFSLPVTIRFQFNPLFGLVTIVGISTVFKAYPEVGDAGLYFSLLALFKPIFPRKYDCLFVTESLLTLSRFEISIPHVVILALFGSAGSYILPPLDQPGFRKLQLFLRHYSCICARNFCCSC